ncbi:MAG: septum formation initiator family protein [Nitrospirae bacterium]|nr:septum formation initiator family protein [Nitrospirota bacterium]
MRTRRKQVRLKNKRTRLFWVTFGILAALYLTLTLIFGESGLLKYIKLKTVQTRLGAELSGIKKQNKETKSQIDELKKDPNLLEELAREHGLTKEGEMVFKYENE